MRFLSFIAVCIILTGCYGYPGREERERAGVQHCVPKAGFDFPTFRFDARSSETSFVIDIVLGPQSITFRDQISGEMMTIGSELDKYYNCVKIEDSQ